MSRSPAPPRSAKPSWKRRIALGALGFLLLGGLGFAVLWSVKSRQLDPYLKYFALRVPKTTTKIYDLKGNVIGVIADQHRELMPLGDVPKQFIAALLSMEDEHFYQHGGVSMRGVARAAKNMAFSFGRRREGASTLTMQLVRVVTRKHRKDIGRKLDEMILARKLEKAFSKDQILESYINEVWFGGVGRQYYGLEAAAHYYFDKNAVNLAVEECATLVGIINRPGRINPYLSTAAREACLERRNLVLMRMAEAGYLTPAQAKAYQARPLRLAKEGGKSDASAPYVVEMVKQHLFEKYGEEKVLEGGYEVTTTLDGDWQEAANEAVRNGLRDVDRRRGFRKDSVQFAKDPEGYNRNDWKRLFGVGDQVRGLILEWRGESARVRVGQTVVDVPRSAFAWAGKDALKVLVRGAVPLFQVKAVDERGFPTQLELDQEPDVQAALLAIDPTNGEIRALVGGYDFRRSQFNRAWQAQRQVGSTMKAFVYGAAFTQGMTPASIIPDVPTNVLQAGLPVYSPKNYERDFFGPITIFEAIRDSRNVCAVRALQEVGAEAFSDFAKKAGIESRLDVYPATALGASDLTLVDMTRAYGTLANLGKQCPRPFVIKKVVDRHGQVLESHGQSIGEQVLDPMATYQLVQCLQGVIFQGGTGGRAAELNWPIAGKTGTTQDHTDTWFLGFSTRISCGVWVGLDTKKTIFKGADGGKVALPIWKSFMAKALPTTPREEFTPPEGMEWLDIDNYTGLRAAGASKDRTLKLAFKPGTAPKGESDAAAVLRIEEARAKAKGGALPPENLTWGAGPAEFDKPPVQLPF